MKAFLPGYNGVITVVEGEEVEGDHFQIKEPWRGGEVLHPSDWFETLEEACERMRDIKQGEIDRAQAVVVSLIAERDKLTPENVTVIDVVIRPKSQ